MDDNGSCQIILFSILLKATRAVRANMSSYVSSNPGFKCVVQQPPLHSLLQTGYQPIIELLGEFRLDNPYQ